jgi:hypothetical protein
MNKQARKAEPAVAETRRYKLRDGFFLHQGRFVRKGGEVVTVTKAEYVAHAHKFETDPVDPDDDE